ncbi:MAG TPA: DNA-directed RNA polymerase subunit alpha [Firmicutes bacterium]|nr:DNA-directed RNA polymerase subunit alpha [Candidatus Fermentithermobacillaceae bacterium]
MLDFPEARIECEEMSPDRKYGRFVVEPLERGYGVTIGNSLRRVLLSSLPGAAVTRVRIQGALHEFTALPGVLEDVSEIILNLKSLVLKMHSPGSRLGRIEAHGPGEVTAKDIVVDPDVEIVDPNVHIATLDEDASLYMEMTIEDGRGYVTAEANKIPGQDIGTIPLDARFTPVRRVNYKVQDTRVGQRTDYDKLTLEIWTDGSMSPDEALETAAGILIDHLKLFTGLTERVTGAAEVRGPEEKSELQRILDAPIEELELSARSFNCLRRAGIQTVGDLVAKTEEELSKVRNMGKKSLEEVKTKLAELGLALRIEE